MVSIPSAETVTRTLFLYRLIWKGLLLGVIGFVQGGWGFLEGVEGRWWGEAKEGAAP